VRFRRGSGVPLVFGHRGASAHALENTLGAFDRARRDGADGVELDVIRCATGECVVFHDDDLRRLGDRADRIAALPFSVVRELRLKGGERIPILTEVFEALGDLLVNVELKAPVGRDAVRLAVSAASELAGISGVGERVLVSSFNPVALAVFHRIMPEVPTGLLFHADQVRPLREGWARHALRPTAVHPDHTLVTPERMATWARAGHLVNTWTVDDPREARRLAALGVDAIIANDPKAIRAAL
jgi:glycerophosphoryl diester phosphodiesterase